MICDNCEQPTDVLVDVVTDDGDTELEEHWCPSCVAEAGAEAMTDLDPRET